MLMTTMMMAIMCVRDACVYVTMMSTTIYVNVCVCACVFYLVLVQWSSFGWKMF